jgi:hypothetical protein
MSLKQKLCPQYLNKTATNKHGVILLLEFLCTTQYSQLMFFLVWQVRIRRSKNRSFVKLQTQQERNASIHLKSVNAKVTDFKYPWMVSYTNDFTYSDRYSIEYFMLEDRVQIFLKCLTMIKYYFFKFQTSCFKVKRSSLMAKFSFNRIANSFSGLSPNDEKLVNICTRLQHGLPLGPHLLRQASQLGARRHETGRRTHQCR